MPVKLRLQRFGSKKRPFYFIVAADSRSPRDGKSIEKIGTYNPLTSPATVVVDRDKAVDWIHKGAQPTDTVKRLLSFKGVMFWKHLLRGVKLNLFDLQTAEDKYKNWVDEHASFVEKQQQLAQKNIAAKKAIQKAETDAKAEVKEAKELAENQATETSTATTEILPVAEQIITHPTEEETITSTPITE